MKKEVGNMSGIWSKMTVGSRALALVGVVSAMGSAWAQSLPGDACEAGVCEYGVDDIQLQPVPTRFKFQARISQSRIPVGDAVLPKVIVRVRGANSTCREEFFNHQVHDSVLNLEIGKTMASNGCDLNALIAANATIKLEVCINNETNCLQPVELGSVPYAVKANQSYYAQNAHAANTSSEAHYAHRATADRDLFLRQEFGTGYFDFATPRADEQALYAHADFAPYAHSGFIRWAPMSSSGDVATVHICSEEDGRVAMLSRLVLASNTVEVGVQGQAGGDLVVHGSVDTEGVGAFRGGLVVGDAGASVDPNGGLVVSGDMQIGTSASSEERTISLIQPTVIDAGAGEESKLTFKGTVEFTNSVTLAKDATVSLAAKAKDLDCKDCIGSEHINPTQVQVRLDTAACAEDEFLAGWENPEEAKASPNKVCRPAKATDVDCKECIDPSDIKTGALRTALDMGMCDGGQYLRGWDSQSHKKVCSAPPKPYTNSCADGEYIRGWDGSGNPLCAKPSKLYAGTCSSGFVAGWNNDGTVKCEQPTTNWGAAPLGNGLEHANGQMQVGQIFKTMLLPRGGYEGGTTTGIDATQWFCAVGGLKFTGGDINEGEKPNDIIRAYTFVAGNKWHVNADFRSDGGPHEEHQVAVFCVLRALVTNDSSWF